jgi:hypothetical protein
MSTDWEKYSTPTQTQDRGKKPSANGVIALICGEVREIQSLSVVHAPSQNRAHTNVFGEKTTEVRVKLARIFTWAIPVSAS